MGLKRSFKTIVSKYITILPEIKRQIEYFEDKKEVNILDNYPQRTKDTYPSAN